MAESGSLLRTGRYWYFVDNLHPEEGEDAVVRLWMALPITRSGQTVTLRGISPQPTRIHEDPLGPNRIAYWEIRDLPDDGPLAITVDFDVEAVQILSAVDADAIEPYERDAAEYERYTRPETGIERTPQITAAAREAVGDEENPWRAAKRIFDYVVREMSYEFPDPTMRGAEKSLARRKGDCGEYSVVFAALCRAVGIPARTVTCNWFTGYGHQWAEFLCPPYGWIPVDASVADSVRSGSDVLGGPESMRLFCENRAIPFDDPDWLFGNLYANRLIVFVGNNVTAGERTFACMQPAGAMAQPEGFEATGCGPMVVHGGFYLFDDGCADPGRARDAARRQLAQPYFDAGLHAEAEEGFRLVLEDQPKDALAWLHIGQIHMDRGELEEAREALQQCIDGEGGSIQPVLTAVARMFRGNGFDLQGRREAAKAEYEAIVASGVDYQGISTEAQRLINEPYRPEEEPSQD